MKSDIIDITVRIRHVSERAVLVDHGGKEPVWLPLSQCELASNGGTHTLSLPEWLAREKGLI